jgi:FHS family glucose/mannose:H+ symporter-like MFS transporter
LSPVQILLHGLFIFVGVATTMLGPLLPSLMRRWNLSDSEAGALFTAQFLMAVLSSLLVVIFIRRFRAWHVLVLGYTLCGFGALGLSAPYWQIGFAGACLYGFGLGLVNPTANLAAATLMPGRAAMAINLLNFFFSIGATFAPPVVAAFVERDWSHWFPVAVSVPILAGAAIAAKHFVPDYRPPGTGNDAVAEPGSAGRMPFALLSMAILFVYVGVEVSSGGWVSTYLQRVVGADPVLAASAPSALWGAVLVSRLATVWILRHAGVVTVLAAGICLTLVGSAAMLTMPSSAAVIAAIALIGVGLGPIFANTLAYFLEHFGKGADRFTGFLFASGGVGGALLPLLIGRISDASGDLKLALATIPVAAILMLAILAALVRIRPDKRT